MKKRKQKKATMREMENVVSNLILENQRNQIMIMTLQNALNDYMEFKKDREPFTKYLEELNGRTDKESSKRSPSEK